MTWNIPRILSIVNLIPKIKYLWFYVLFHSHASHIIAKKMKIFIVELQLFKDLFASLYSQLINSV